MRGGSGGRTPSAPPAVPRESTLHLVLDARRARKQGADAIARRQRDRLATLVSFSRAHSPYHRELYRDVPADAADARHLPVTRKDALMARFDEWVTDTGVTAARVRGFVERPDLIGERFLGRYTVVTASGTTGTPGIFFANGYMVRPLQLLRACLGCCASHLDKFVRTRTR